MNETYETYETYETETVLRRIAREAIHAGRLPSRRPDGVWGGPGSGVGCAVCGLAVKSDGLGFELEFARKGSAAGLEIHHVHIRCFAAWEVECQAALPAARDDGTIANRERDPTYRQGSM